MRREHDEARAGEQTAVEHGECQAADVGRFQNGSREPVGAVALDRDAATGLIRPTIQKARGGVLAVCIPSKDLVELRVVGRLLAVNISLRAVRNVARYLRQHFTEESILWHSSPF